MPRRVAATRRKMTTCVSLFQMPRSTFMGGSKARIPLKRKGRNGILPLNWRLRFLGGGCRFVRSDFCDGVGDVVHQFGIFGELEPKLRDSGFCRWPDFSECNDPVP